ncbi:predicted coding region HI1404 [Haemophilus influenzae Rd KW20]|uniref:Uncharacterized protein HI_1404 n=2 Tax=Haemophilus influenzae TaxID=727 RepID=Y1404_HAEIN|nr:RecName: Full=Uncharacterized protein HI_1404 [Haemophilus influenzae Rd KW20]AAC23054.1 predicted coding region HI1404 [Haemophilus influenzae Rd KW20]
MTVSISVPSASTSDFKKFAINHLDILPRQAGVQYLFNLT